MVVKVIKRGNVVRYKRIKDIKVERMTRDVMWAELLGSKGKTYNVRVKHISKIYSNGEYLLLTLKKLIRGEK